MNQTKHISSKIFEAINTAIQTPPQKDGIRMAKVFAVCSGEPNQNHAIDYALRSVREATGYSVILVSSTHHFLFDAEIKFSLPDKSIVFLELLFLKDADIIEKTRGLQATSWINFSSNRLSAEKEAALDARCGRFP